MYHDWAHYKPIVLPPKEGLFLDISSPGERRLRFASEAGRAQGGGFRQQHTAWVNILPCGKHTKCDIEAMAQSK